MTNDKDLLEIPDFLRNQPGDNPGGKKSTPPPAQTPPKTDWVKPTSKPKTRTKAAPPAAPEPKTPLKHVENSNPTTREGWLIAIAQAFEPWFADRGHPIPAYRVSCSWPSSGGTKPRNTPIGQCWPASASTDNHCEIFISPLVDDPLEAAATLFHELIHAAFPDAGHKGMFKIIADLGGLSKPFPKVVRTPDFNNWVQPLIDEIGPYPHHAIMRGAASSGNPIGQRKKQKTHLRKAECEDCGYTARITLTWLERGIPVCPNYECDSQGQTLGLPELTSDEYTQLLSNIRENQ